MQKFKTLDGYYVFNIEKEEKHYYLADENNCKKNIGELLNTVEDIKFDSLIIIFGIDTGEYLNELYNVLCRRNRILIFEPNEEIFNYNKNKINNNNVRLFLYDKNNLKRILYSVIDNTNFNNLYVHAFGNYAEVFKEEYEIFIENLDIIYFTACSPVNIAYRFREIFVKNLICNLKKITNVIPLNSYENINKGIPAIIVSAGPSLDKNLIEMVKHKDEIDKYFIIAGSRTLKALMIKGIKPDMIVSIDPIDDNYDMMKDYLEEEIPLAFYEYSNRHLIRDYKGDKILLSTVLVKTIEKLNFLKESYFGGSVAHPSIDVANIMGCSPIILVGQDLAFTYDKDHSDSAIFKNDEKNNYEANLTIENVFGEKIRTTPTLNQFRAKMEEYIEYHSAVEFINVSYGANIEGAPHKELCEVVKKYKTKNIKRNCIMDKSIKIDANVVINDILGYVEEYISKANIGKDICEELLLNKCDKSLIDTEEDDEELEKFLYIIGIVNNFESSPKSVYLGGYLNKFLFDIKEEFFNMSAKDYESLTSSLRYQSKCFLSYFERMKSFLEEVKSIVVNTVLEFY